MTKKKAPRAPSIKAVHVTVAKGLSRKDGEAKVWAAAKRKGKTDARSLWYDPKTGKGGAL